MKKVLSKYKWYREKDFSCCGYILEGSKHLVGKEMHKYFVNNTRQQGIEKTLIMANGRFAIAGKLGDQHLAACDRLRTYPLFYYISEGNILIGDSALGLLGEVNKPSLNYRAVNELLLCGFTLNSETLVDQIKQVQAGEYIHFDTGITRHEYHNFIPGNEQNYDYEEFKSGLKGILGDVFSENLAALNNRTVVLPLSGGYDSRLIAVMLKKYYRGRVITFTYGSRTNPEFNIAKKVAEKLKLEWIPVVYDDTLTIDYISDRTFESYYKYSSEISSIFFFQDYFAVKYLKEKQLVPADSVFIPGHTGDILSGGHISPGQGRNMTPGDISYLLSDKYFNYIKCNKTTKKEIRKKIRSKLTGKNIPAFREMENWEYKERQAKMIINSASVFSFFAYSWIIPFWDNRLVDFFGNLHYKDKLYSKLYRKVLAEEFFSKYGLNFKNELKPSANKYRRQIIKDSIKKYLPAFLVNIFTSKNDPYHYEYFTGLLKKEIRSEYNISLRQDNYYNAYIAQYLASKTKDLIYGS